MLPLEGVVVIDLGKIYSGPYCTLLLSYLGAEVIKIEPPGGEHTRHRVGADQESYAYVMLGSNKKNMCIDLKKPRGRDLLLRLVQQADVLVENFARGTMERLGISSEELRARNPKLIVGSIKGFNARGPLKDYLAMDITVQAMTGIMSSTGFPDNPPVKAGVALADMMSGMNLALGIVAALYERGRTGRGQHVEAAMQDAVIPALASNIAGYFEYEGALPERTGNRHNGLSVAPYNVYQCSDGWVAVLCGENRHWQALLQAIDRTDYLDDEAFATPVGRARNIDAVDALITEWTRTRPRDGVVERLVAHGVPCAPVRSVVELIEDPFTREAGMLPEVEHPTLGPVRVFGNPLFLSDADARPIEVAPPLGYHTDEILASRLGLDEREIKELRKSGVVG